MTPDRFRPSELVLVEAEQSRHKAPRSTAMVANGQWTRSDRSEAVR
jgi:hypothetical protein